jgi:hypothetical protein
VYGYLMVAGLFGLKHVLDRKDATVPAGAADGQVRDSP